MNKKLEEFHLDMKAKIAEIKTEIEKSQKASELQVISYFTYSFNLSDGENLCLGHYHIRNLSGRAITHPYICIKVPKDGPFTFTGKYVYEESLQKMKRPDGWLRMNTGEDPDQFWLKPLHKQSIEPNETISFSDFQIKWTPTKDYAGSIMGFTYSAEHQEGIGAINAINISGSGHS